MIMCSNNTSSVDDVTSHSYVTYVGDETSRIETCSVYLTQQAVTRGRECPGL